VRHKVHEGLLQKQKNWFSLLGSGRRFGFILNFCTGFRVQSRSWFKGPDNLVAKHL
jgi:hypothetical protein